MNTNQTTATTELVRKIRDHRGDVCVTALMKDGVYYVKVVKCDLIAEILRMNSGSQMSFDVKDGVAYIDSNHT